MPLPDNICLRSYSDELETTISGSELTRIYICRGFESAQAAEAALSPHLPVFMSNASVSMPVALIRTKHVGEDFRLQRALLPGEGTNIYATTVNWSTKALDTTKTRWGIVSGNEQKHLTYALSRITSQSIYGGAAPPHEGAINVQRTSEGWEIKGVDIPLAGDFTYTLERSFPKGTITIATLRALFFYKLKVNVAAWGDFAAGEACFKGAQIQNDIPERLESIQFEFEISADTTPFVPPFGSTYVPGKRGWDYFWVQYEEASGGSGSYLRPRAWYIDRIMPFVSFTGLDTIIATGAP